MVGIKIIKILTDDSSWKLTEKMNKIKSKILEYSSIKANIVTYKKDHEFEIPFAGNKAFASILIHGVRKQQNRYAKGSGQNCAQVEEVHGNY